MLGFLSRHPPSRLLLSSSRSLTSLLLFSSSPLPLLSSSLPPPETAFSPVSDAKYTRPRTNCSCSCSYRLSTLTAHGPVTARQEKKELPALASGHTKHCNSIHLSAVSRSTEYLMLYFQRAGGRKKSVCTKKGRRKKTTPSLTLAGCPSFHPLDL